MIDEHYSKNSVFCPVNIKPFHLKMCNEHCSQCGSERQNMCGYGWKGLHRNYHVDQCRACKDKDLKTALEEIRVLKEKVAILEQKNAQETNNAS